VGSVGCGPPSQSPPPPPPTQPRPFPRRSCSCRNMTRRFPRSPEWLPGRCFQSGHQVPVVFPFSSPNVLPETVKAIGGRVWWPEIHMELDSSVFAPIRWARSTAANSCSSELQIMLAESTQYSPNISKQAQFEAQAKGQPSPNGKPEFIWMMAPLKRLCELNPRYRPVLDVTKCEQPDIWRLRWMACDLAVHPPLWSRENHGRLILSRDQRSFIRYTAHCLARHLPNELVYVILAIAALEFRF